MVIAKLAAVVLLPSPGVLLVTIWSVNWPLGMENCSILVLIALYASPDAAILCSHVIDEPL